MTAGPVLYFIENSSWTGFFCYGFHCRTAGQLFSLKKKSINRNAEYERQFHFFVRENQQDSRAGIFIPQKQNRTAGQVFWFSELASRTAGELFFLFEISNVGQVFPIHKNNNYQERAGQVCAVQ